MLKKTPLHSIYFQTPGVKLVDFGGWEMPIQFADGILAEHHAVRKYAGIFDVSHMGEIFVQGPKAGEFLDFLLTNRVTNGTANNGTAKGTEPGRCVYSPMCREDGGTVDDLLVYVMNREEYLLVVNASNTDKDFQWIDEKRVGFGDGVEVQNQSDQWALLALQGPVAQKLLTPLVSGIDLSSLKYYHHMSNVEVGGVSTLLSRTGYTGEDGFELYCNPKQAVELWQSLVARGAVPCGLGARDLLRLESRLPLYGHELSDTISPLEAGLGMFVKLDKENFVGKEALKKQKQDGIPRAIYGLEMMDAGVAREGYPVFVGNAVGNEIIGEITSGGKSPERESFIALALLTRAAVHIGDTVEVEIRGKRKKAKIVRTPFYKRADL